MNASPLDILYDDGPVLVVNKPAGLLTQAPAGIDSLEVRVKEFFRQREGKPADADIYLGLPHRLDRPVSGAIVLARHVRAAQRLSAQFENRTVSKSYWAFVEGVVTPDEGTWTRLPPQAPRHGPGRGRRGRSPRGEACGAALPRALAGRAGDVARDRARNRPHAPDSHPGGLARARGRRRLAVRQHAAVRRPGARRLRDRPIALHARQLGVPPPDDATSRSTSSRRCRRRGTHSSCRTRRKL